LITAQREAGVVYFDFAYIRPNSIAYKVTYRTSL